MQHNKKFIWLFILWLFVCYVFITVDYILSLYNAETGVLENSNSLTASVIVFAVFTVIQIFGFMAVVFADRGQIGLCVITVLKVAISFWVEIFIDFIMNGKINFFTLSYIIAVIAAALAEFSFCAKAIVKKRSAD